MFYNEEDNATLSDTFAGSTPVNDVMLPATSQLGLAGGGGFNQIITAQPTPVKRDLPRFLRVMGTLAQAAGDDYYYSWDVTDKRGKKSTVEGGSIKLANDLAREYGNCIVDTYVDDKPNEWVIYAKFIDLETGFSMVRPFRQRKSQSSMKTDSERQLDIAFQIGASKAIRNVVLNSLQSFAEEFKNAAKKSLLTKIKTKPDFYRDAIVQGCKDYGWSIKIIEHNIGKPHKEWKPEDMARIMASLKSVKDGMASFEEVYPDPDNTPKTHEDLQATYTSRGKGKKKVEEPVDNPINDDKVDDKNADDTKLKEYSEAIKEPEEKEMSSQSSHETPSVATNNSGLQKTTPKPEQTDMGGGATVAQGGSASPKKEVMPVEIAIPKSPDGSNDYELYTQFLYEDVDGKSGTYKSWFARVNAKGLKLLQKERPDLFSDLDSRIMME